MKSKYIILFLFALLLIFPQKPKTQIKRSRGEDLPTIVCANTIGFGNLWGQIYTSIREDRSNLRLEPLILGEIGLTEIIDLKIGMIPFERGFIGKSEAHLKLTLPNNEKLRTFGIALIGDLVLSTEEDTLSISQDSSRPAFQPLVGGTLAMDYDFFKRTPNFPLKLYLNLTNMDYDRFLAVFNQFAIRFGTEYRLELLSFFISSRLAFYKEKITKDVINPSGAFDQYAVVLGSGIRYRKTNFWKIPTKSFSVGFILEKKVYSSWYNKKFPYSDFYSGIRLEWAPFFRETKAEVVRSMLLMELKEKKATAKAKKNPDGNKNEKEDIIELRKREEKLEIKEFEKMLGSEDEFLKKQKEIEHRRKRIKEEFEKIEGLIE